MLAGVFCVWLDSHIGIFLKSTKCHCDLTCLQTSTSQSPSFSQGFPRQEDKMGRVVSSHSTLMTAVVLISLFLRRSSSWGEGVGAFRGYQIGRRRNHTKATIPSRMLIYSQSRFATNVRVVEAFSRPTPASGKRLLNFAASTTPSDMATSAVL